MTHERRPLFERRHYVAIADALAGSESVIDGLDRLFSRDNPRYERERFVRRACGLPEREPRPRKARPTKLDRVLADLTRPAPDCRPERVPAF